MYALYRKHELNNGLHLTTRGYGIAFWPAYHDPGSAVVPDFGKTTHRSPGDWQMSQKSLNFSVVSWIVQGNG